MDAVDSSVPSQQFALRLKGQFTPAFLTLTSIIQGVAFTTLVARVEATPRIYPGRLDAQHCYLHRLRRHLARIPDAGPRLRLDPHLTGLPCALRLPRR